MAIRTSNAGGNFELVPVGMHLARCFRVIDCGTHTDRNFGKKKRTGWLFWELPNLPRHDSDEPQFIGKRYTLSHNPKAILRIDLESWYGQRFDDKALDDAGGFDLERLIGRPALLNIVHSTDGKYANIASVNPLPAGLQCPPARLEPVVFALDPFNNLQFEKLSDSIQTYIRESEEYQALFAPPIHGVQPQPGARDGLIPGRTPPRDDLPPVAAYNDVPFGDAQPQSRSVMPKPTGSKFDDMADDIPF